MKPRNVVLLGTTGSIGISTQKVAADLPAETGGAIMKIIGVLVIVLLTTSVHAEEQLSDEKQILKLEDDWVKALVTHDRGVLDRIVARDFTFIEPDGTIKNRAEYIADRASDVCETESFENVDLKVQVFGSSALASGLAKITEKRQGVRYRFQLRWKELWMKNAGKWQVITSQATPVNPTWDTPFVITR